MCGAASGRARARSTYYCGASFRNSLPLIGRKKRSSKSEESGSAAVEFALTVPLFLSFVMAIISLAILALNAIALHFSLHHAARFAALGVHYPDMTREESIAQVLGNSLAKYGVSIENAAISICPTGLESCSELNAGVAHERVRFGVEVPMQFLFTGGELLVKKELVFRNQPF